MPGPAVPLGSIIQHARAATAAGPRDLKCVRRSGSGIEVRVSQMGHGFDVNKGTPSLGECP
jgi:hypothetical protein